MFRSLHIASTGMAAQQTHLDGISNNIANANTVGYKKQRVEFEDLLYQTLRAPGAPTSLDTQNPMGLQVGSGVRVTGIARIQSQGPIKVTDNPLDLAIEGEGFFSVETPDGSLAYTRAGALKQDVEGRVVTPDGYPIDPPITIPPDATSITIGADGQVAVTLANSPEQVVVGEIELASFVNPAGLRAEGHNLYRATEASGEAMHGAPGTDSRGTLMQGALEHANVDVVEEMIGLITAQRAYEINSKVITTADEMLKSASQLR